MVEKKNREIFHDFARKSTRKNREREREEKRGIKERADSESLRILEVRVTCHGPRHVTRGAVDPRGASSHEDRDGGCLLSTACHISVSADFSSPRYVHGMLDNSPQRLAADVLRT